jgi:uncharacterized membrane protein
LEAGALGLLACGLAVLAFLWHARRSAADGQLLALRGLAVLALALAALQPVLASRKPVLLKPRLAVIVDQGHSMSGKAGKESRLAAAARWIEDNRGKISERAEPVLYAVSSRGKRLAGFEELGKLKPESAAFQAAESLRDVAEDRLDGRAFDRGWLFSDGNAESGELEGALRDFGAPLDVVGVGPPRRGKELAFVDLKAPDFAFLHGRFWVEAELAASDLGGKEVSIRLLRREGEAWLPVSESRVTAASDYDQVGSSLPAVAQRLGAERYRVEATAGGVTRTRELRVEVVRQKYRIMFLAGRPSPEYANLREFLKSDPNHDLVSFVILRNPENASLVADYELSLIPFPAEEIFIQSLPQFDLFIIENFAYTRFRLPTSYLESLRSFVARGGALLVMGGENAFNLGGYRGTPLEEVLPVSLSQGGLDFSHGLFKPRVESPGHPLAKVYDTAEESREAWSALPALDGWAQFASVRPGAAVVAVHPTAKTSDGRPLPVIAARDYGRGKVMLVSSDSTWRWRLGAASDLRVAAFYARFWSRAVQYLTGSLDLSKVKFAPVPDKLPGREPAVFSVRVFDEGFGPAPSAQTQLSVTWTEPGGTPRAVSARETEPGSWRLELTGLKPGLHALRASASVRGKPWGDDKVEFRWDGPAADAPMDLRWLKKVADASGGGLSDLASADADALLDKLPPVVQSSEVTRRYKPAASPWWLLLAGLLLLSEWGLRRRRGLP